MLISAAAVLGWRWWQVKQHAQLAFTPQTLDINFQPPQQAIAGQITEASGTVQKNVRGDSEMKPLPSPLPVPFLKGEAMNTGLMSSAKVLFPNVVTINLDSNAEIALTNPFLQGFLVKQNRGQVTYQALDSKHTISVRALSTLVVLNAGTARVNIVNSKELKLYLESGELQFSIIDKDNNTQVYSLPVSQSAEINDQTGAVSITK
jgi:hypothetical protein